MKNDTKAEMTATMAGVEVAARILRSAGHELAACRCEDLIDEYDGLTQQLATELQRNTTLRSEMEKEVQRTADAYSGMHDSDARLQEALSKLDDARSELREAARWAEGLEKVLELTQQELNNANKVANEAEAQFRKAKEWNALMELELKNARSIVEEQYEDIIAGRRQLVEVVERTDDIFSKLDELATHHRKHAIEFESEQDNAIAEVIEEFIALHCLEDLHSSVKLSTVAPTEPSPTETEEKR